MTAVSVVPTTLWVAFSVAIVFFLFIDLALFGKEGHQMSKKSALLESGLWVALALGFNLWFGFAYSKQLGVEFLTGYLVKKSLSVDNLFVILLIFSSFKIPKQAQHRVLFYGVLGDIVLRAIFILIGASLIHNFHWILYVFGAILVLSSIKFLRETKEYL